ncbi:MAG: phosphatase PAP2 family protein [Bacteroidota bacterium]
MLVPRLKFPNPARLLFLLLTLLCLGQITKAQSPYQLTTKGDIPLAIGGSTLLGVTIALNKKTPALSLKDTIGLNVMDLPSIDRRVVYNWSTKAQKQSDVLLYTSPIAPLVFPLVAGGNSRQDIGVTYAIALEGMLLSYSLTELTKLIVRRKRPYVYGKSAYRGDPFNRNSLKSFFSGHTGFTATNYFMTAKMYSDFYPNSNWRPVVWGTAAIIPGIVAWKRVKAGKHFITDVLVGYIVGAGVGILLPEVHKIPAN